MFVADHVRITIYQHVFVGPVLRINVDRSLLGEISRLQLNVVVVVADAECALEQRVWSVSSDVDARPARGGPSPRT